MVISMERDADLHMAQLMPLPLTVSCFSKIQIGFTFLVPAHPGNPGIRAVKRARLCVCVREMREQYIMVIYFTTSANYFFALPGVAVHRKVSFWRACCIFYQ